MFVLSIRRYENRKRWYSAFGYCDTYTLPVTADKQVNKHFQLLGLR